MLSLCLIWKDLEWPQCIFQRLTSFKGATSCPATNKIKVCNHLGDVGSVTCDDTLMVNQEKFSLFELHFVVKKKKWESFPNLTVNSCSSVRTLHGSNVWHVSYGRCPVQCFHCWKFWHFNFCWKPHRKKPEHSVQLVSACYLFKRQQIQL